MPTPLSNPPKVWSSVVAFSTSIQRWVHYLLLIFCTSLPTLSVQAQDVIYGLTERPNLGYSVYALKSDGSNFTELKTLPPRNSNPIGSLVEGSDGFLYGVTVDYDNNGSYGGGLIYKVRRDGAGYQVLRAFSAADSLTPSGSLVRGSDGLLYGMASAFRVNYEYRLGSIYKINNDGSSFTVLKTFSGPDGSGPVGSLVQGKDGFFYGRTNYGGTNNCGTLFKINSNGTGFSVLRNFSREVFYFPDAIGNLIQGSDGFLYGTMTSQSGKGGETGTIFKIGTDGSDFSVISSLNIRQGGLPVGSLVEGSDGFFYGTTSDYYHSGVEEYGYSTFFKVRADGTDFTVLRRLRLPNTDYSSASSLVPGSDGFFYGILSHDYSEAIYKVNSSGSEFSIIQPDANFSSGLLLLPPQANCQASGTILRELWANVPGSTIASIPVNTPPTLSDQLTSFRTAAGYGDNYGQRVRGYICAPTTGNYTFFMQGDDKAELYLSTDDDPTHKHLIAKVGNSWSWTQRPEQQSAPINLVAGKSYYVEVLHKEGTGTDVLRIGWRTPDMASGSEPVIIPGSVLSPFQTLSAPVILEVSSSYDAILVRLNWNARPTETGYVVERATAQVGPYTKIDVVGPQPLDQPNLYYRDQSGQPNMTYYYRFYATTTQGATTYSNVVSAKTPDICKASGTILRELWANVPGSSISSIPVNTPPILTSQLTSFRTAANYGDNYGQRIRGYICPPLTGDYRFYIQGDDKVELYLSTDADPAHKQKIASVTVSWNWSSQQPQSAYIHLVANNRYYIEALHKEGTGGDVLRIGWAMLNTGNNSEPVIIPGAVLSPFVVPNIAGAREVYSEQPPLEALTDKLTASPNPFSEWVTIRFSTAATEQAQLQIFDLQGRLVGQLYEGLSQAGEGHQVGFDGSRLSQGMYLVKLTTTPKASHLKLLLTK